MNLRQKRKRAKAFLRANEKTYIEMSDKLNKEVTYFNDSPVYGYQLMSKGGIDYFNKLEDEIMNANEILFRDKRSNKK